MPELPDDIYEAVEQLCSEGDDLLDDDHIPAALEKYTAAVSLLPSPREDYEDSAWVLAALGDGYFHAGDYARASEILQQACHCRDAAGNAFLYLRLGQSQFELGQLEAAGDSLAQAFECGDLDLWEDCEPKYRAHVKPLVAVPEDGWPDWW